MTELKTLKDIEYNSGIGVHMQEMCVQSIRLKIEAIKDIKFLQKSVDKCSYNDANSYFECSCMACSEGCGMCVKQVLINYIMWKFNISEEDLK